MAVHHHKSPIVIDGLVFQVDADNDLSGNVSNVRNIVTPTETGSFVNGASVVDGEYDFDGVDDYISFPNVLNGLGNKFTFDFWVNFDSLSGTQCIFHKTKSLFGDVDIGLFKLSANNFHFTANSETVNSTTLAVANKWYNVVVVYEALINQKIYINGVFENTNPNANAYVNNNLTPINLGAATEGTILRLNGIISNGKIYKRLLTATEIQQNYNATKNKYH